MHLFPPNDQMVAVDNVTTLPVGMDGNRPACDKIPFLIITKKIQPNVGIYIWNTIREKKITKFQLIEPLWTGTAAAIEIKNKTTAAM